MSDQELLIENSGMSFQLDTSTLTEGIKKDIDKNGLMVLRGIPATVLGEKNSNDRIYTKKAMKESIRVLKESGAFDKKYLYGSASDHPEKKTHVPPGQASHVVTDAYIRKSSGKDILMNDWLVLPTRAGRDLRGIVEAGAAIPTSIRGLGKINEKTREVENYSFLSTDGVGNPSASTYATSGTYKVQVESVDEDDVPMILESINTTPFKEQSAMPIDLGKSLTEFRTKYFKDGKVPVKPTKDMISEMVAIEIAAIRDKVTITEEFTTMKDELLGKIGAEAVVESAPAVPAVTENSTSADLTKALNEATDILNKTQRKLGAEQVVAAWVIGENITLEEQVKQLKSLIPHYNEIIDEFEKRSKSLTESYEKKIIPTYNELITSLEGQLKDTTKVEEFKARMTTLVDDIKDGAKKVILSLETDLNKAIHAGNTITEHFFASQYLNRVLAESLRGVTEAARKNGETRSRVIEARKAQPLEFSTDIGERIRMPNN